VDVIYFFLPKPFRYDPFRVLCRKPETALTVIAGIAFENLLIKRRLIPTIIVSQLPSRKLSKLVEGMFEPFTIKVAVENNCMEMVWHQYIRVDTQILVLDAEIQAISDNLARSLIDENRQPFHHGECHKIDTNAFNNTISFHGG